MQLYLSYLVYLLYIAEPCLWVRCMSACLGKKCSKKVYVRSILAYYVGSVFKQGLAFTNKSPFIPVLCGVLMSISIVILTYCLFRGRGAEKLISCGCFFCLICVSELIAIVVQIILAGNLLYVISIIRKKDREIHSIESEMIHLEEMLQMSEKLEEIRHDLRFHAQVVCGLVGHGCYEKLNEYLHTIFEDIQEVESCSVVPEPALAVVLSQFMQESREKGIQFVRHIMIKEFYMNSKDLCTIVSNMLQNIKIIRDVANKYGGTMEIVPNQHKWFEITCFIPDCELIE